MKQVDHIQRHLEAKATTSVMMRHYFRNERKQAANNLSFYINKTYKDVVAHSHLIVTNITR